MASNRGIARVIELERHYRDARRKDFASFAQCVMPSLELTDFHASYYRVLNAFAEGKIKKLIVSVPPQHGKSLASTQLLPAFLLGKNPDLKIAIASYSAMLANKFNKRVQRVLATTEYKRIFSSRTKLTSNDPSAINYTQTSDNFEIVGAMGSLMSCGREGSLTGNQVDIFILDDLYKDAMEANSPIIRDNCFEWYTSVAKTRMHNNSQELIVFTRWHEDDLIGRVTNAEPYIVLTDYDQLESIDSSTWVVVNFEAIKEGEPTEVDSRQSGEALWEGRHSAQLLSEKRRLDPQKFQCMYQGDPSSTEGQLYGDKFKTYTELPSEVVRISNYTDTADMGSDYLCSICYVVGNDGKIYITDVLYTQEGMEVTESATAQMFLRNGLKEANIESNNGGRGFARQVGKLAPKVVINAFHQSQNKEARVLTNAATVLSQIVWPSDWRLRWPTLYTHLTTYKRVFRSNKYHDCADVITGIVEIENANKLDFDKLAELQAQIFGIKL